MSRRKKSLIAVSAVFAAMILIPVIRHYQLRFAVESYVAQLKAKGEPMELAQVIPPPVPREQNSAPLFLKAAALLTTNDDVLINNPLPAMRGVAPGKAMVGWTQSAIRSVEGTNTWEEVRAALAQEEEALKLLGQITNGSTFDFDLQYAQRSEMLLKHLGSEKKFAQRLSAAAVYDLQLGDATLAAEDIRVLLALVEGTDDERTAISQLVRIAIAQITVATTWELLQSSNLAGESLVNLQADWSRLEFIQAAEHVLPVERECGEDNFTKWRSSSSELKRYFDLAKQVHEKLGFSDEQDFEDTIWDDIRTKIQTFFWRYWWSYSDELRSLKGYDVLICTVRMASTNNSFEEALDIQDTELRRLGISKLKSSLDSLYSGKTDLHSMLSESIVTLAAFARKVMRVEVAKQMTITAIALKRYQLKLGNFPADLNSLVPDFLPAVPLDPVDGQPLRYRRNADGTFLLYSVGENGVDDGGNPALEPGVTSSSHAWQNPHALDWVWPQPATAEEIQAYNEEEAKNGAK